MPPVVSPALAKSDYVSVRRFPFVLCPATPANLNEVHWLVHEATAWLRESKDTNQWALPWPDLARRTERMRDDLIKGKTWLVWDGSTAAGTITIDTEDPVAAHNRPVWPDHKRREPALYVRRVIVRRSYSGLGLGAGLLDWAADVAERDYRATLIRIDVWTTNLDLHDYYLGQRFIRCERRDPRELDGYPSQALFERQVDQAGSDYRELFTETGNVAGHRGSAGEACKPVN